LLYDGMLYMLRKKILAYISEIQYVEKFMRVNTDKSLSHLEVV